MNTSEQLMIRQIERKEREIIRLMYTVTERRLAAFQAQPAIKDKALCAAAQAACSAIQTFIETAKIG